MKIVSLIKPLVMGGVIGLLGLVGYDALVPVVHAKAVRERTLASMSNSAGIQTPSPTGPWQFLDLLTNSVVDVSCPAPVPGPKGDPGIAGTNGTNGTNGVNGTNGLNGFLDFTKFGRQTFASDLTPGLYPIKTDVTQTQRVLIFGGQVKSPMGTGNVASLEVLSCTEATCTVGVKHMQDLDTITFNGVGISPNIPMDPGAMLYIRVLTGKIAAKSVITFYVQ